MELETVVDCLLIRGVQLEIASDGHLRLHAPSGALTIELICAVHRHKEMIVANMTSGESRSCAECGEALVQGWCSKHVWAILSTNSVVQSSAIN